jgi:ABC-type branched-subunit amino acid transport system ATPase component
LRSTLRLHNKRYPQGISFRVGEGEIISLLGRNGAGRSTTIKTIMGQLHAFGTIRFKGERIDGLKAHEIARRGLGYVPEDRAIFPDLTVRENLLLGMKSKPHQGCAARWSLEDTFTRFPLLGGVPCAAESCRRRAADAHHLSHADGQSRPHHGRRADRRARTEARRAGA